MPTSKFMEVLVWVLIANIDECAFIVYTLITIFQKL